jgi:hypothetical protein
VTLRPYRSLSRLLREANAKLTNAALIDLVKKVVLSPEMVAVFAAESGRPV